MRLSWSFGVSAVISTTAILACAQGVIIACSRNAASQEVEFKPRWDGVAKPRRPKQAEERQQTPVSTEDRSIYSFDRYADQLRQICNLLERDHRRERLSKAAFEEIRVGVPCKSCKAFLREVVEQCHYRKMVVPRPSVVAGQLAVTPSADNATPRPSGSVVVAPAAARYPLTEALDRVSSLSSTLYDKDGGEGGVFEAVRFFADVVMKQGDLTPAERDYYGIFTTYLLSAWHGRPNSPLESPAPLKEEIRDLFE